MKLVSFLSLMAIGMSAQAQLNLQTGQHITVKSTDSSAIEQKRGEESMNMTTLSNSVMEYVVIAKKESSYQLSATLSKININFDGFGQKMVYDSEDKTKQEGMMATQLKDKVGKADTIEIGFDGKAIEKEEKEKKGNGRGNMMKMMSQQSGSIENAFLFVPTEVTEGKGWKTDATKDGVKTQTLYFVESIKGDIMELSFKRKSKGTKVIANGDKNMTIDIDNLSNGNLTVNRRTSMVINLNETTNSNSKTTMMGQEMPSKGTTVSNVSFQ